MKEEIFKISGMHCSGCVMTVKNAIENLPGIEKVEVELEKKEAKVIFDSEYITIEDIKEAVLKIGYKID
ncbi:MAG TPA: copper chaperone [Firmicutes bacterium]|nr:copper chaperone [Bacillota bacterium]